MSQERNPRGFAALSPERRREIASIGGKARGAIYEQRRRRVTGHPGLNTPNPDPTRPTPPQNPL